MQNKLITELTNEELLKLVDKEEFKKEVKNPYIAFISKYNIQSGTFQVASAALFELYKIDHPRTDQRSFTKNFKKYIDFSTGHHGCITYFYINKSLLDVSKSVEKLLEKPKSQKKVRNRKRHIEEFLKAFNLKPGNNSVHMSVLIDLYDRWCYKFNRKKIAISELQNLIPIFIPFINEKYYKVHDDMFKVVSKETIKNIMRRHEKKDKKINN